VRRPFTKGVLGKGAEIAEKFAGEHSPFAAQDKQKWLCHK